MGVSFACQSVVENKGKQYNEQVSDALKIVLGEFQKLSGPLEVLPSREAGVQKLEN